MKMVALIGVITLASSTVQADCAWYGLKANVATPPKTRLTGGGGILVTAVSVADGKLDKGDVALKTKWTLKDGTQPKKTLIAPGLAVYEMPFVDQVTPVELFDGKKVIGSVIGSKAKVAQFPAPKVKSIELVTDRRMHTSDTIQIELDGDPPADAWGIVIADANGKPRAWNSLELISNKVVVYNRRDCQVLPNGTIPSKKGDKITLFWVNAHGRTSDRTQSLTIKTERIL